MTEKIDAVDNVQKENKNTESSWCEDRNRIVFRRLVREDRVRRGAKRNYRDQQQQGDQNDDNHESDGDKGKKGKGKGKDQVLGSALSIFPRQILLLDGGTGEELFLRGVPDDRRTWSAKAIIDDEYHTIVKDVHRSFINAGSKAITTNSYGIIPSVFGYNDHAILHTHCTTAAKLAREVVDELQQQQQQGKEARQRVVGQDEEDNEDNVNDHNNNDPEEPSYSNSNSNNNVILVLGSLGPLVESYRPDLIMEHEMGVEYYTTITNAMAPYVDTYIIETMSSVEESMQAMHAIGRRTATSTTTTTTTTNTSAASCLVSYSLNSNGRLRSGESVCMAIQRMLQFADEKKVKVYAVLFNCSEPEAITIALNEIGNCQDETLRARLLLNSNRPNDDDDDDDSDDDDDDIKENDDKIVLLGAYANRLTAVPDNWTMGTSDAPQPFRTDLDPYTYSNQYAMNWIQNLNVRLIGGCCGITPEHINVLQNTIQLKQQQYQ